MKCLERQFVDETFLSDTMRDSLVGRKGQPVYRKEIAEVERGNFTEFLKEELRRLSRYYVISVDDEAHLQNIRELRHATKQFEHVLFQGELVFGRAQKALNVYLKYLWCDGQIPIPPHCPFDNEILTKLSSELPRNCERRWTYGDEYAYREWVAAARTAALRAGQSLAEWELEAYESIQRKSRKTIRATAEFLQLSREPQGDSHGWKFNREEIQRKL